LASPKPDAAPSERWPFDISGKTILVTGGARGLGRMIAEGIVRAGADVLITSRKADEGEDAASTMRSQGRCEALVCDLSSASSAGELAVCFRRRRPSLHVLINNAGRS
jgi:NAD(P)-dependent dehydrogenase (short-subunit alcohol dehydrogenase family)